MRTPLACVSPRFLTSTSIVTMTPSDAVSGVTVRFDISKTPAFCTVFGLCSNQPRIKPAPPPTTNEAVSFFCVSFIIRTLPVWPAELSASPSLPSWFLGDKIAGANRGKARQPGDCYDYGQNRVYLHPRLQSMAILACSRRFCLSHIQRNVLYCKASDSSEDFC